MLRYTIVTLSLLLILVLTHQCADKKKDPTPDNTTNLPVEIRIVVNNRPIKLNSFEYVNAVGDSFEIRKFKFFLSNFSLRNTVQNTTYQELGSYHLINAGDFNSTQFELKKIPIRDYDILEFAIGIDSAANLSLNQVGDLTPSSDMAWDWETGYKFVSLEGQFKSVSNRTGGLVFHVGENPAFTKVRITTADLGGQKIDFNNGKKPRLIITADVDQLFKNPNTISFDSLNNTMSLRSGGQLIVQNYANGFLKMAINYEP